MLVVLNTLDKHKNACLKIDNNRNSDKLRYIEKTG